LATACWYCARATSAFAREGLPVLHRFRQVAQILPALRLSLNVLRIGLRLPHGCLDEADGNLEVGRVDDHQQIAPVHKLIVGNRQLDDAPGNL